jgi:hypothetical protein
VRIPTKLDTHSDRSRTPYRGNPDSDSVVDDVSALPSSEGDFISGWFLLRS